MALCFCSRPAHRDFKQHRFHRIFICKYVFLCVLRKNWTNRTAVSRVVCSDLGDEDFSLKSFAPRIPIRIRIYAISSHLTLSWKDREERVIAEKMVDYGLEHSQCRPCPVSMPIPLSCLSCLRLQVRISLDCEKRVFKSFDVGAQVVSQQDNSLSAVILDVYSAPITIYTSPSLPDVTKRSIDCYRLILSSLSAQRQYAFFIKESVHDSTLGGRTWDSAFILSSFLSFIFQDKSDILEDERVVPSTTMLQQYKGKHVRTTQFWRDIEKMGSHIFTLDTEVCALFRHRVRQKLKSGCIRIFEVGCGGGLSGLVLLHLLHSAAHSTLKNNMDSINHSFLHESPNIELVLTDLPEIIPFTKDNVLQHQLFGTNSTDLNRLDVFQGCSVAVGALDWTSSQLLQDANIARHNIIQRCHPDFTSTSDCLPEFDDIFPEQDVIIAADVAYNTATHDALITTLVTLSSRNTLILFAYKSRFPETEAIFFQLARKASLRVVGVLGRACGVHVFLLCHEKDRS